MHDHFVIVLRRGQRRRTDLAGFCLLLFSLLFFLFASVRTGFKPFYPAVAAMVMVAGLVVNGNAVRRHKAARFSYWLLAAAIGWALMPYGQWVFFIFLLFAGWEARAMIPLTIYFSADRITITSFPKRQLSWSVLQSVILKDGLLTVDFKNNRLLQSEVSGDYDEAAFNAYVRQQMSTRQAVGGSR